jgi:hypothetical protein
MPLFLFRQLVRRNIAGSCQPTGQRPSARKRPIRKSRSPLRLWRVWPITAAAPFSISCLHSGSLAHDQPISPAMSGQDTHSLVAEPFGTPSSLSILLPFSQTCHSVTGDPGACVLFAERELHVVVRHDLIWKAARQCFSSPSSAAGRRAVSSAGCCAPRGIAHPQAERPG